jgi:flagellar basal-body rod modification protein FlgD
VTTTNTIPGTSVYGTLPATSATPTTDSSTSASGFGNGLDKDTFLKLLVAQMQYQNPDSPTDGAAYIQQMATFSQVEQLNNISKAQTEATSWQLTVAGEGMLGKSITGTNSSGKSVSGTVSGINILDAGPQLVLADGSKVDVSSVLSVTQPASTGSTKS